MFRPGLDHTIFKSKFSFISSIVSLGCESNQIVSGDACTECDAGQIPNHAKGQTNLKWFFQMDVSSKKRTKKFDFTICRLVFVCFLEENEDTKNIFRN